MARELLLIVIAGLALRSVAAAPASSLSMADDPSSILTIPPIVFNKTLPVEKLEPQYTKGLDVKRVKTRYGPFPMPSFNESTQGMRMFRQDSSVVKPCDNCTITWVRAGLEFGDGSYANVNTSMWLHHIMLVNTEAKDTICPSFPERFFASGNERTAVRFGREKKRGYHLGQGNILLILELMNEARLNRDVVVTLDWEYIPDAASSSKEYTRVTPLWLDVSGFCAFAFMKPPNGQDQFTLELNPRWKSTIAGDIVAAGAHLHDGGTDMQFVVNNKTICNSPVSYGGDQAFENHSGGMDGMGMGEHISSVEICADADLGTTKQGDEWSIRANYDFAKHPPTMEDGKHASVMGIGLAYIAKT